MRIPKIVSLPILLIAVAGCGAQAAGSPTPTVAPQPTVKVPPTPMVSGGAVAAVVNGHDVSMSSYRLLLNFGVRQYAAQKGVSLKKIADSAMQQVVVNAIVAQYAAQHHIAVTNNEVLNQVLAQERQAGGLVHFKSELKGAGLTMSQYEQLIRPNLLAQKVARSMFPASSKVEAAHVRHILIALHPSAGKPRTDAQAHALAEHVLSLIQHGGNFATLARKYSDDPGSADKGGDLGNVFPGETVPPFNQAAFHLPLNKPTIIKSVYGYHVIDVLSRGMVKAPAGSQQQQQQTKFSAWIQRQLKTAKVQKLAKVS
ncbi:MAG TPA: peptidylprolyl isomerase [Chloroflexota bacterium]|nr:peptidylprolyl isomerase [Chloroflexota bacterium]